MGLDMYLTGEKFFHTLDGTSRETAEGFEIKEHRLSLGYWRKHPNLHGFIVDQFAGGEDLCQEIPLTPDDLQQIIEAVKTGDLPFTTGFFFGTSDLSDEQKQFDLDILERAYSWLTSDQKGVWKSIYYQASW